MKRQRRYSCRINCSIISVREVRTKTLLYFSFLSKPLAGNVNVVSESSSAHHVAENVCVFLTGSARIDVDGVGSGLSRRWWNVWLGCTPGHAHEDVYFTSRGAVFGEWLRRRHLKTNSLGSQHVEAPTLITSAATFSSWRASFALCVALRCPCPRAHPVHTWFCRRFPGPCNEVLVVTRVSLS